MKNGPCQAFFGREFHESRAPGKSDLSRGKRTIPPFRRRAGKPGDNRTVPSTKCLEYSVYVMAKAMAAAKGEKIRAMKNISLNTAYHLAK